MAAEGGGGGYDIGLSSSMSSSSTSGNKQNFGDISAGGGLKLPTWAVPVLIVALFLGAITLILRPSK